jgi:protein-S-isoprenylcysteine O-methyltransferase Ste14
MSGNIRSAVKLSIGIAIFAGLPLVGWGAKDVQGFIGNPARLGYTVIIILLQVFIVFKFPEIGNSKQKKPSLREQLSLLPFQIIPLAIVITAAYTDRHNIAIFGELAAIRYLGLIIFALGFILMNWAEISLGKQFSVYVTIQDDHKLVTHGPYRYIRHPRYLGIIMFAIGISMVYRSWLALILVVALTLTILWRIKVEEALLHKAFGTEWEVYTQKSWYLVPFVY